jgi:methylated-DNA-[protein]-cysteine S-methyltransferase
MDNPADQYTLVMNSPLGRLGVQIINKKVHRLDFLTGPVRLRTASGDFEHKVETELKNYFENPNMNFNLPLELAGTPFQQRVWQALTRIPFAGTLSYGELAASLGSGARAVGNACRHNPVPIIVPCHRVVAAHGIGGYAGSTSGPVLDRKRWLLEHEGHFPALKKTAVTPSNHLHPENQRNNPA